MAILSLRFEGLTIDPVRAMDGLQKHHLILMLPGHRWVKHNVYWGDLREDEEYRHHGSVTSVTVPDDGGCPMIVSGSATGS